LVTFDGPGGKSRQTERDTKINQCLLRQKAAHAEKHNKNKQQLQTKLTAMK